MRLVPKPISRAVGSESFSLESLSKLPSDSTVHLGTLPVEIVSL